MIDFLGIKQPPNTALKKWGTPGASHSQIDRPPRTSEMIRTFKNERSHRGISLVLLAMAMTLTQTASSVGMAMSGSPEPNEDI